MSGLTSIGGAMSYASGVPPMKRLPVTLALTLTACGGGSVDDPVGTTLHEAVGGDAPANAAAGWRAGLKSFARSHF
jgi:hypothetical protein